MFGRTKEDRYLVRGFLPCQRMPCARRASLADPWVETFRVAARAELPNLIGLAAMSKGGSCVRTDGVAISSPGGVDLALSDPSRFFSHLSFALICC